MVASVMLTRITCVFQPPPSAKWPITTAFAETASGIDVTGCDVTRNSPRWLAKVRSAAGATGADALKVKVPANDGALNGAWSKNFAICPLAASGKLFWPKSFPAWSVKLKEMTTGELFVLAKATPVLIGPFTSAYVRPELIES